MSDPADQSPKDVPLKTVAGVIERLEELLDRVPMDVGKDLRARIAALRTLLLDKRPPALVLLGRRGAGKSSLVNALFGAKVAELGHVTAQTGRARWHDLSRDGASMSILDTRGFLEGSAPAEVDAAPTALASIAVELRRHAPDIVVYVVKASDVDSAIDTDLDQLEKLLDEIRRAHGCDPPLIAAVSHCDLLEPKSVGLHKSDLETREDISAKTLLVQLAEETLSRKFEGRRRLQHVVATLGISSYMSWRADGTLRADERWRIDELALALFRHLPDAGRAELARATRVRNVQHEFAKALTKATAALCAAIAAAPIPIADIVPLTVLQGSLVTSIAWIAGRSLDRRGGLEVMASLGANVGAAFAFREAVRSVVKFIAPGGGSVVSASIAFSATMAIGAAARAYYIDGVSLSDARRLFRRSR
jgi:predicted GTPase